MNSISQKNECRIGLVIMASGLGKRFGGNKLMAALCDKPMIRWVLDASENIFDERIVVTRSREVEQLCNENNIKVIYHEFPGRNDTVRLGLQAIGENVDGCFFCPADQPLLEKKTLKNLYIFAKQNNEKIIRACYEDTIGTPVYFPEWTFDELKKLPEKNGGSFVIKQHLNEVLCHAVGCKEELMDIDTTEELEIIKNILHRRN